MPDSKTPPPSKPSKAAKTYIEELLEELEDSDAKLKAEFKELGFPDIDNIEDLENFDFTADYPPLLRAMANADEDDLFSTTKTGLEAGFDPNECSPFGESPLNIAFQSMQRPAMRLLLEAGADTSKNAWNRLHLAVLVGTLDHVNSAVSATNLKQRDTLGRTPFLLACRIGAFEISEALLPLTPTDSQANADDGENALHMAARSGNVDVVRWLIDIGFDVDVQDNFGGTPLLVASEHGHSEVVHLLLAHGANPLQGKNISKSSDNKPTVPGGAMSRLSDLMMSSAQKLMPEMEDTIATPAEATNDLDILRQLLAAGVPLEGFSNEVLPELTGAARIAPELIAEPTFHQERTFRFGQSNPETMDISFWREQIRTGRSGYQAQAEILGEKNEFKSDTPVWSFDRFGRTATKLADGRWILIAGEHEDAYDPDFCIYNDVVVLDGKGGVTIFGYSTDVFPPTDFHSATLVEDRIILIGNLGYQKQRTQSITQVLSLSLNDFSVTKLETTGPNPGWINRHTATLSDRHIAVCGGNVEPNHSDLKGTFVLNIDTLTWTRAA